MMGLGIGLTPSADDYLTGLVLILFISGHPAEKYKEEFYLGLQRGRNNTTLLSAITLEAALQQRCRKIFIVLFTTLFMTSLGTQLRQ